MEVRFVYSSATDAPIRVVRSRADQSILGFGLIDPWLLTFGFPRRPVRARYRCLKGRGQHRRFRYLVSWLGCSEGEAQLGSDLQAVDQGEPASFLLLQQAMCADPTTYATI
jgi:hypothetical protein